MFLQELNEDEQAAFLELAQLIASANGYMDDSEQEILDTYMGEMEMDGADKDFEHSSLTDIVSVFKSTKTKRIVFLEAIAVAFADEAYDEPKNLIEDLKNNLGISEEDYQEFKNWIININALYSQGVDLINA